MPLSCDGLAKAPFIYFKGKLPSHLLSAFLVARLFPILDRLKHFSTSSISPLRFFHTVQRTSSAHKPGCLLSQWTSLSLSSSFLTIWGWEKQVSGLLGWRSYFQAVERLQGRFLSTPTHPNTEHPYYKRCQEASAKWMRHPRERHA